MRGYVYRDVPATGTDESRFLLTVNPAGNSSEPVETFALVANIAANALIEAAPRREPETKTVPLQRVGVTSEGEYLLVSRGSVSGPVVLEPVKAGKFVVKDLAGGALLDSVLLGAEGWQHYRPDAIWEALRDFCAKHQVSGYALRRINDDFARLLIARSGLVPPRADLLPNG